MSTIFTCRSNYHLYACNVIGCPGSLKTRFNCTKVPLDFPLMIAWVLRRSYLANCRSKTAVTDCYGFFVTILICFENSSRVLNFALQDCFFWTEVCHAKRCCITPTRQLLTTVTDFVVLYYFLKNMKSTANICDHMFSHSVAKQLTSSTQQ